MSNSLTVVYQELLDRARELEAPLPAPPSENPVPPCALEMVKRPTKNLVQGAEDMRTMLARAETVRRNLAESLRNAAFAYELVDDEIAAALRSETPVGAVVPRLAVADPGPPPMLGHGAGLTAGLPIPEEFQTVERAAWELEQADQGASFTRFADAWENYQSVLRDARKRFRPFQQWGGDDITGACKAVENNFNQQANWLNGMAVLCQQMADQARPVVAAHKRARREHVTAGNWLADGVYRFDYKDFVALEKWIQTHWNEPGRAQWWKNFYTGASKDSEAILATYRQAIPSSGPVTPQDPPPAYPVDKPKPPKPYVPTPDDYWRWEEEERKRKEQEELEKKQEKNLRPPPRPPDPEPEPTPVPTPGGADGNEMPMMPNMPMMPMMPSTPQPDPALADALKDLKGQGAPKLPHGGGGVKPASAGGVGVPAAPLQSWGDDGAAAKAAAAGPGANVGRGVPGVGGMPGGAGGGMGGAPAQAGDKGGKGKRIAGDQEALYTEDRAWTEGVVGRRSAKEVPKQ
jgi:hypothetical protein